jgi:uncharacterized membrane protein YgdD (TMEM256/DUF423 family)
MALVIVLGAFGAHGLKERLDPQAMDWWLTAVRYHAWHSLALFAVELSSRHTDRPRAIRVAGVLFLVGVLLFSGSLYTMSLTGLKGLGAITPVGGLAWIAGWISLAVASRPAPMQS